MTSRKRQSSHLPQQRSTHVQDPFLHPFLTHSFDPVAYLNSTLPSLSTSTTTVPHTTGSTETGGTASASVATSTPASFPLPDLSNHAQTSVSQLNAHTTRLTNTLTQLTDDILRSGSRLAYQVELLRGETLATSEVLNDRLSREMAVFLPSGAGNAPGQVVPRASGDAPLLSPTTALEASDSKVPEEPAYVSQLRTLTLVRDRLELVIQTFGDAMEFVFPPSELSTTSSFLSVSAPEPGVGQQSTEDKGQAVLQRLRDEMAALLADADDPIRGIENAAHRIEQLKELSTVWKGTAEEKGREKFIEGLATMVEDRHRDLLKEVELAGRKNSSRQAPGGKGTVATQEGGDPKSYTTTGLGLLNQLQKMRVGI